MGNCFKSEGETIKNKILEDFYYVCRDKKYLLKITDSSIGKFKFDNSIKLRKDSGVGYLNDGRIIIGGGTDGAGCLTNKVFIIDPVKVSILAISNLPVASKEGAFFQYKEFVYYVGGIKDSDDEEILAQEQSSPIMRFYMEEGYWEVFYEKKANKLTFQDFLKKKAKDDDEDEAETEITYKEILYSGMFLIGSKVYFINGQKMSARGVLHALPFVYSIDFEEENFGFRKESFKSPLQSFRPICGSYGNKAFLAGGLKPNSKSCNMDSYFISFDSEPPEFTLVPGLKLSLDDCYPIISTSKAYISISYPNLAVYDHTSNSWFQFTFKENLINRNSVKYSTPVLESLNQINDQVVKTKADLVIYGPNTSGIPSGSSIQVDSFSSGALSPGSKLKFKLPPGLIVEENMSNVSHDSFNDLNRSGISDDFSVEQRIEFQIPKNEGEPQSPHSSANLSDSGIVAPIKKKMAPIAKQAKKVKKEKEADYSFNKDESEVCSSIDFNKGEAPVFSESSVVSDLPEPKIVKDKKKQKKSGRKHSIDSNSSESFEYEQSWGNSSKQSENKIAYKVEPQNQIKKKLAPIAMPEKKAKEIKQSFSISNKSEDSSDSFEFEPEGKGAKKSGHKH